MAGSQYTVQGSGELVVTGSEDDLIYNEQNDSVTIDAGAGNDEVYNEQSNSVMIDGGIGDAVKPVAFHHHVVHLVYIHLLGP